MSKRNRIDRFQMRKSGLFTSLSHDLVECALSELKLAFDEKRKGVYQVEDNHYSPPALGSILLLLAGLEAWLNEAVSLVFLSDESAKDVVGLPITRKFREILGRAGNLSCPELNDLELLVQVRNEIAHFIPYIVTQEDNIPPYLAELQRRGLFITSQDPPDFSMDAKLASYRLAHWAWDTVATAVMELVDRLGLGATPIHHTARNFERYKRLS